MAEDESRNLRENSKCGSEYIAGLVAECSRTLNLVPMQPADAAEYADQTIRSLFKFGYIEKLWEGIEHLLPPHCTPWSPQMYERAVKEYKQF